MLTITLTELGSSLVLEGIKIIYLEASKKLVEITQLISTQNRGKEYLTRLRGES
ncbi:MAG: hypothetical protein RRA45_06720 [Saccharolobus sp.]|uniref:hypothetical protein n=1 Tax=Saccharolobus sp. TaxID=2100761 RepID=UPI0028CFA2CF|nr:hypothetical protein [Saccharolobus sp.]MDT7861890.1 hypothetical protein [Saccharolobus sp.]